MEGGQAQGGTGRGKENRVTWDRRRTKILQGDRPGPHVARGGWGRPLFSIIKSQVSPGLRLSKHTVFTIQNSRRPGPRRVSAGLRHKPEVAKHVVFTTQNSWRPGPPRASSGLRYKPDVAKHAVFAMQNSRRLGPPRASAGLRDKPDVAKHNSFYNAKLAEAQASACTHAARANT